MSEMRERALIYQHDRTTANGVVLDGLDDVELDDRKLSHVGARVQCPACNTIGRIEPVGERSDHELSDKQPALEDDLCRCACHPSPRLIASQRHSMIEA
uniref:PAAR domain-containing protein n=2 Tax=Streptomyces TaxID=1883 RepID=UPI0036D34CCF